MNGTRRDCHAFQHDVVHCAHGTGLGRAKPKCPEIVPLSREVDDDAEWVEGLTVVVPDYAFPRNIYHFAGPVADLVRTIEQLPNLLKRQGRSALLNSTGGLKNLNIMLQGSRNIIIQHRWKRELLEMMLRERVWKRGVNVSVHNVPQMGTEGTGKTLCMREAAVLGRRGHHNTWPFQNASALATDGTTCVALDAVAFRSTTYKAMGIRARLPNRTSGRMIADVPPFVVGYAKRDGQPSEDGYYRAGSMRRFGKADEKWFVDMLHEETKKVGAEFVQIVARGRDSLKVQAERMSRVGFVVGIHGANLVNSLFMKPFGVLMEILPKGVTERCYVDGMNSGLRYLKFEPGLMAGAVESGCYPLDAWCASDPRQRMIKLAPGDRERMREKVREGIRHLQEMRQRYADSLPLRYSRDNVCFEIDDR